MKEFEYTITDPLGIHARPAGMLCKTASKYNSTITIEKDGKTADAKRIFAVMSLGAKCAQTLKITADGTDEAAAAKAMEEFLKENL